MKKILVLSIAMTLTISLIAQKQPLKMVGTKKIEFKKNENYEPTGRPAAKVVRPDRITTKGTKTLSKVFMGESSNPYTLIEFRSTCLTVNTDLNLINYTARTNETTPVLGNNVAALFSTDGGISFNSTLMRPWTSPNSYSARYPSGVIYNPAGNTDPSNAFIAVSGPALVAGMWGGSFFASQKFDGTLRNEQFTLYSTDTAGGTGFLNQYPRLFMQNRNNKVFVLGDANEDDGAGFTSINGVVNVGEFQGDTISWSRHLVTPDFVTNTSGYVAGYGSGSLVMDDIGVNGYMVFVGRNNNATDQLTYQPVIYRTTDGGQNWSEEVFNWNNIAAIQSIASVLSPVDRPSFSSVLDITMDINGRVHFAAFVHGAASNHPDSLFYYTVYSPWKGIVYDIHQTPAGWDAFAVDTVWAQDAMDYPFLSFVADERFQMSRTPDGSKIIYAWIDTDPAYDSQNKFPDIFVKIYNVFNDTLLPKQNITKNTVAEAMAMWMYLGDYTFENSNGTCTIPVSYSEHGAADTDPVTHYYLSDIVINSIPGNLSNLSGRVYYDYNDNGQHDIGEQYSAGQMIKMEPGPYYTFTNNNGYYNFIPDTGNKTVTYLPYPYWYSTSAGLYNISVDSIGHLIDTLDFGIKCRINVQDVSVYITGTPTRIGFDTQYILTYKNWGTVIANGTVEFQYDPLLTYITSNVTPLSHTGNTLVYGYDTLGPGAQRMILLNFQVPSGVQYLGDTLHSYAMITPLVPDTFVTNNYDTLQQVITGSYDPNDKTVSPAGYEQWGFVHHGQRLSYTIRFQNTGTDTAFNVVLRDTISNNLDMGTILFEAWSHPVTWELHNGNELYFIFQNILLPDSNVNEPESNGFVRYSISPKPGLADGATATNTAYIFFDYNPAVATNTTLNTFVTNIPVAKPILEILNTVAFPNPASEKIYINLPEFTRKVEVYNIKGDIVQQLLPKKEVVEINVKDLPRGVYVVRMYSGKGVETTKFVKE